MKRYKINISGRVQGVGFRPVVYRYARIENLTGFVFNTTNGVVIEVEGRGRNIKNFLKKLKTNPPCRSKITKIKSEKIPAHQDKKFVIKKSIINKKALMHIPPDISICSDCRKELFSKNNRRYLYPFINCTNCGPRFSIIEDIPYDRKKTTMREFKMCGMCKNEYGKPADRRFHAQPDACWDCGPDVRLIGSRKSPSRFTAGEACGEEVGSNGIKAIQKTIELLKKGKIIAIKGIGGFHIACDAANEKTVKKLRLLKKRPDKPFAVMMPDIKTVKKFCDVSKKEEQILLSPERPIVLLRKLPTSHFPLPTSIAPNNNHLGVMLPYTPLHYLLFHVPTTYDLRLTVLIMTSGNRQDEPICKNNKEAVKELSGICDYFLVHNRNIYNRCDDSIVQVGSKGNLKIIRRSRGYVPNPIPLPTSPTGTSVGRHFFARGEPTWPLPAVLATGAELKNTFCLTRGNEAYVSQYIGDLKDFRAYQFYEETIGKFKKILRVKPEVIAYDIHPDYFSTQYAALSTSHFPLPTFAVQHHHAHIASVCAENNINEKIIGVAFDGTGYGTDGNIWGGEFLIAEGDGTFQRKYHLRYIKLPGGDAATGEIWRIGFSYLYDTFKENTENHINHNFLGRYSVIKKMIDKNINCPLTSSVGRLFDAVASIINLRQETSYEAQAAIELEQIADLSPRCLIGDGRYEYAVIGDEIDVRKIIIGIIEDLNKNKSKSEISVKFHNTLAEIICEICCKIRKKYGINKVALSGGVFQNMILLRKAVKLLKNNNFSVFFNKLVPANDGGISFGQAWVAFKLLTNKKKFNKIKINLKTMNYEL